jgi:hypothetical protein
MAKGRVFVKIDEVDKSLASLKKTIKKNVDSAADRVFKDAVKTILPKVLRMYKTRLFQKGLSTAGTKIAPLKNKRPKRALNPVTNKMNKVNSRTAPPYLRSTGALFKSISFKFQAGAVVVKIEYPDKILGYLQKRYGVLFSLTKEEVNFIQTEIKKEIEKYLSA